MGLTKSQQLFVLEYSKDPKCGKTEAARRAGYSAKRAQITGCELMKNPEVLREVDRLLKQRVEKTSVAKLTAESVIDDLNDIDECCKQAGAGAWQVATRVKIAELKGKYLKMFTDRVEVDIDDKLMERLEAGRRRSGLERAELPAAEPPVIEGEVVQ